MRSKKTIPESSSWLQSSGSLTKLIKSECGDKFWVEVLNQNRGKPTLQERELLSMRPGEQAIIREVYLWCGTQKVVFARTIIPLSQLSGRLLSIARIGNKPLGEALFAQRDMKRRVVKLDKRLVSRSSLFYLGEKKLLVTERGVVK